MPPVKNNVTNNSKQVCVINQRIISFNVELVGEINFFMEDLSYPIKGISTNNSSSVKPAVINNEFRITVKFCI